MESKRLYLIWSYEHDKWWKPYSQGYTEDVDEAGRYEEWEAFQIVRSANKHIDHDEVTFVECMIPVYEGDKLTEVKNKCECECDCAQCKCIESDCPYCGC